MLLTSKGFRPQRTFLQSLRTTLKITAFPGVVPYSLRGNNIVFEAWQLVYNIFCTVIFPFLGICAIIFPDTLLARSSFSTFVFVIQFIPYSFSIFAFLFWNISYHGEIARVTSQLLSIESRFFLLNMEPTIRVSILKDAAMPVVVVGCSIVHWATAEIPTPASLAIFITFQYANLYLFIIENLILFFLNVIQHYQCLLINMIPCRESVLVKLCSIQDDLADVTSSIQKVYGFPVLCMVLSNLCFINVNMFFAAKESNDTSVIITICWIIIVFILIFRIPLLSEQMKEKREDFYTALYRMVKKDKSSKFLNNDYLKAHLLRKRNFSFNLAGFAEVDMTLVSGVISATATYTVILLQMGKDF